MFSWDLRVYAREGQAGESGGHGVSVSGLDVVRRTGKEIQKEVETSCEEAILLPLPFPPK